MERAMEQKREMEREMDESFWAMALGQRPFEDMEWRLLVEAGYDPIPRESLQYQVVIELARWFNDDHTIIAFSSLPELLQWMVFLYADQRLYFCR